MRYRSAEHLYAPHFPRRRYVLLSLSHPVLTLSTGASTPTRRVLWTSLPFLAWLALFLRVPLPSAMAAQTTHYLDAALARTAVLGVSLIALLSGSAAASAAGDTWEAFFVRDKM